MEPINKACPLRGMPCTQAQCAWWCEWINCCTMVAISAKSYQTALDLLMKDEEEN